MRDDEVQQVVYLPSLPARFFFPCSLPTFFFFFFFSDCKRARLKQGGKEERRDTPRRTAYSICTHTSKQGRAGLKLRGARQNKAGGDGRALMVSSNGGTISRLGGGGGGKEPVFNFGGEGGVNIAPRMPVIIDCENSSCFSHPHCNHFMEQGFKLAPLDH